MLSTTTFGKAPAAMYLAVLLNERNDQTLTRKVGRVLSSVRELLHDIVACHLQTDEMKTASFSKLVELIDRSAREAALRIPDEFVGHIVTNILVGEIRTLKRRCARAAQLQQHVARGTAAGVSVRETKATPRMGEPTEEERIALLQERSREYLKRKGKRNTLY